MKKKKTFPRVVVFAVLTMATAISWLFFNTYRALTKKEKVVVSPEILAPLDPKLDQKALEMLETRYYIEESQIPETVIVTPSPTPEETSVSNNMGGKISSPSPQESPTTSPSANL